MSSPAFSEALALLLCLPSPDWFGPKVGKKTVDLYGNNVVSEVLPGDHWRIRHDKLKMAMHSTCISARLPVTVEVWGLFSHLIPVEGLTRMETGIKKRQAIVPDFRVEMPCPRGGTKTQLAELKVISCCESRCTPGAGANVRATDKRAQGLQVEYRRKARRVDQNVI